MIDGSAGSSSSSFTFQYGRLKTYKRNGVRFAVIVYIPIWTIKDDLCDEIYQIFKDVYIPIWTIKDFAEALAARCMQLRLHSNMDD